ncbi:MAG: hypothetical protein AVDCRST_MAG42-1051, partial [uncultured Chthoniobacterales bacterium]
ESFKRQEIRACEVGYKAVPTSDARPPVIPTGAQRSGGIPWPHRSVAAGCLDFARHDFASALRDV